MAFPQACISALGGSIAPEWALGAFLGVSGFAGSYLGAPLQRQVPELALQRLLGVIACAAAARHLQQAATTRDPSHAAVTERAVAAATP